MNKQHLARTSARSGFRRRALGAAIALAVGGFAASPAHAIDFDWGDNWNASLDTTVSYGVSQRIDDPSEGLIQGPVQPRALHPVEPGAALRARALLGERRRRQPQLRRRQVLSEGTEAYDRGDKFAHYQELPLLQHYVLASQHEARIEVYTRAESAWVLRAARSGGQAALSALGGALSVDRVYEGIALEPPPRPGALSRA